MIAEGAIEEAIENLIGRQFSRLEPIDGIVRGSLGLIGFICDVEYRFGIKIPNDAIIKFETVEDLVNYIGRNV